MSDYRQRLAAAINAVLNKPNGSAYRGTLPAAILAVRDDQLHAAETAIARVRRLCELTIAISCRAGAIQQAEDTLAVLDGLGADLVVVRAADLDLVMNRAGDPATVAEYPAAAQRIQDAIAGGRPR